MPTTRSTAVGGMPSPVQAPPAVGAGRGHVRVRPVVDVEQGALRAFGEDALAGGERVVEVGAGVGDVRVDDLVEGDVLVDDGVDVEAVVAVDLGEDVVLVLDGRREALAQGVAVEQVHDADAGPGDLVDVRRPDAAAGRADGFAALGRLGGALLRAVERLVVRHDEVRRVRHLEPAATE